MDDKNKEKINIFLSSIHFIRSKSKPILLLFMFILFFIYIAFTRQIEDIYIKIIIEPILNKFTPSILIDIFVIVLAVYLLYKLYNKVIDNYQSTVNIWIISLLLGIIYGSIRCSSNFKYYPLTLINFLAYTDFFWIFPLYTSTLLLNNFVKYLKKKPINNQGFVTDNPILNSELDLFKRGKYALELSEIIRKTFNSESIAIGINGTWGSGKTSFLNFIKEDLSKDKFIIINFNPWDSINKGNLIINFFEVFEKKISRYSNNISKEIIKYSKYLTDITDNSISKVIKHVTSDYSSGSIAQSYSEVNKIITEINRKIIVFIDDIDRLQKEEIIQVIKIIRNTANFYNTIFIVAYDKVYISNAFQELSENNKSLFLDKIFQIELDLPYMDSYILRRELVIQLKKKIGEKFYPEIEKLSSPNTSGEYPMVDDYIKNMRDITRFVNLFTFQFEYIKDEVLFADYFNITLVKMRYPLLIKLLFENQVEFFENENNEKKLKLFLKYDKGKEKTKLFQYLEDNDKSYSLSSVDMKLFEKSIKSIFGYPVTARDTNEKDMKYEMMFYSIRPNNSIVYPNSFYGYFTNTIFATDISEKEWENALNISYDKMLELFKEWINKGARQELYYRIKYLDIYSNKEIFESIIKAIFELSRFRSVVDINEYEAQYLYEDLLRKLTNIDMILNLYSGKDEEYKDFLKKILQSDIKPYNYSVGLIAELINPHNYPNIKGFPLTNEELADINTGYLKKYLGSIENLDKIAWGLYYDCKYIVNRGSLDNKMKYPPKAKDIMFDFIMKKGIEYMISSVILAKDKMGYYISDGGWALFDNPDIMFEYFQKHGQEDVVKEFLTFFVKAKQSNFGSYIPYSFTHIKFNKE